MKIFRQILTLLALLLAIGTTGGSRSWLPPASSLQEIQPSNSGKPSRPEESPDYIIEHYATTIRFENDGTTHRELRVHARVLSDEGAQQLSRLAFDYDQKTEQLDISDVEVHQAGGGTIGVLPHAVLDHPIAATKDAPAYENAREKSVRIPGLKSGDTLQYIVTLAVTRPPAPGNFWLEHHFLRDGPVKEEIFEVSIPRDRPVKLETRPGSEAFTTTDDVSGATPRRIYRWKLSHEGRSDKPAEEFADYVGRSSLSTEQADIRMSSFLTWEDLGRWYQQNSEVPGEKNAALASKAAEIEQGCRDVNEKLAALYLFVAQKIRTIDLAPDALGYRSLPPIQVLTQGYGTQLDKHNLLSALLESIGLRAIPVLVNRSHDISERVPSPAQFNQLVTAVQAGSEWIWLDTAPEVAPFRMLAANLRNKRGLGIRTPAAGIFEQGNALESPIQWMITPADPPFLATQNVTVSGELSAEGKLTARVRYTMRGDTELLLRVAFHRAPQGQWKNLGQLLAISDGFRGKVTSVIASIPGATEKPFDVQYRIAQDGIVFSKNQKAEMQVPLPSFGLPEISAGAEVGKSIELGTPLTVTAAATISLPRGVVAGAPIPVGVKRDYAEYRSTYQSKDGKITATRQLRFLLRELPAERSRDYAAFARVVRNDEAQPIALERLPLPQGPQTTTGKPSTKSISDHSTRSRK